MKYINKAPVIGFIRYSQKIKFRNQKKERDVFEHEYFEYRFNIFKNVTLKSLQLQTNSNFVLLLLHSESMPSHYKERFIELETTNAFLYNVFMKDTLDSFEEALTNSIDYASFENDVHITFRIDNDDAVQTDFVEKLNYFLKLDFIGYTVSLPLMFIVERISDQLYRLEESYFPANSIGLAHVTHRSNYKTVLNLGDHNLVNDENPLLLLARNQYGGLLTINGKNEANTIDTSRALTLNKVQLNKFLFKRNIKNIDLESLHIIRTSKFSVDRITELLLPPIFKFASGKIKNYFS